MTSAPLPSPSPSLPREPVPDPMQPWPLDSALLVTSLSHLYRGEMQRMTVWRTRLDATSQWAIVLTTALTTFALGTSNAPHFIMLLGLTLNAIFMVIEGRRYQHLHHSKRRITLLERDYFAPQLAACGCRPDWATRLSDDLRHPHITISLLDATRLRLRRNYLMLAYFITAVWLTKLYIHPQNPGSLREYYERLAVGNMLPPWFVLISALIFVVGCTVLAVSTPSEESLEHWVKPGDRSCPLDSPD